MTVISYMCTLILYMYMNVKQERAAALLRDGCREKEKMTVYFSLSS